MRSRVSVLICCSRGIEGEEEGEESGRMIEEEGEWAFKAGVIVDLRKPLSYMPMKDYIYIYI